MLTSDLLVEELRRQGRLTDEQAEDHPQRSIITRALGPEAEVDIDTLTFSARPGDVFLICSDGLTTMIRNERIAEVLESSRNLDEAAASSGGRGQRGRWSRQHHGGRLPGRGGRRERGGGRRDLIGPSAEEAGLDAERARRGRAPSAGRASGAARRRRLKTAAMVLAALLVIAGIVVAAVYGARQVYFLGIDEGGRITLYRGLPYELPLDLNLYNEVYSVPVQAASLPEDRRDSVTDHELRSRDDAVADRGPGGGGGRAAGAAESGVRHGDPAETGSRRVVAAGLRRRPALRRRQRQGGGDQTHERPKPRAAGIGSGGRPADRGIHRGLHHPVE